MHIRVLMLSSLVVLLAACGEPKETQPPLSSPANDKALLLLQTESHSPDPTVRSHCMEGLQVVHDPRTTEVIEQGLHDNEWIVRFAASMAAGVQKADGLRPALNTLVTSDASGSVKAGCIFALHQLGDDTHMSDLALLLRRPDSPTRANTALVLGMLGNQSAVPLLQMSRDDSDIRVKFEITRALARLGDESSIHVVESWSVNKFSEDQLNAMVVAGDLDPAVGRNILLLGLQGPPSEFPKDFQEQDKQTVRMLTLQRQLVAAASLAKLRDGQGAQIALDNLKNPEPRFRVLAAVALGEMLTSYQAPGLEPLLSDPEESVRVAGAAAIVKVYARARMGK